jgi:hypothetical protein
MKLLVPARQAEAHEPKAAPPTAPLRTVKRNHPIIRSPIGDLMEIAERTNRTKFQNQVLKPLLSEDLIRMTIQDNPTSRNQRYETTDRGRALLGQLEKERGHP